MWSPAESQFIISQCAEEEATQSDCEQAFECVVLPQALQNVNFQQYDGHILLVLYRGRKYHQ
jgi:hypothetical protein